MLLTKAQYDMLEGKGEYNRGISPLFANLWQSNGQQGRNIGVPYKISKSFNSEQKTKILNALKEIQEQSCIR